MAEELAQGAPGQAKELDTLPTDAKAALEKMGGSGPLVMQALLKFVEQQHEQAPIPSGSPEPLKLAVDEQRVA